MRYLLFAVFGMFIIKGVTAHTVIHAHITTASYADTSRPGAGKPVVTDSTELSDSTLLPAGDTTVKYSGGNSSAGGRVQVKGYYRKNGTYVKPHTRSAPRSHH